MKVFGKKLLKKVNREWWLTVMSLRYHQEYSKMLMYLTLQIALVSYLETNVVFSTNKCVKILANRDLPKHLKCQHQDMFCRVAAWTSLDLIVPLRLEHISFMKTVRISPKRQIATTNIWKSFFVIILWLFFLLFSALID